MEPVEREGIVEIEPPFHLKRWLIELWLALTQDMRRGARVSYQ